MMKNLLLEQRGPSGLLKTWRLRSSSTHMATFGSSKHADLRSPDTSIHGIQGYFEWSENSWNYYDLNLTTDKLNDSIKQSLTTTTEIKIGTTILVIKPYADRDLLVQSLGKLHEQPTNNKQYPIQLFTVTRGEDLLETKLVKLNDDFISTFDGTKTKLKAQKSEKWIGINLGNIEINQRTVYVENVSALKNFKNGKPLSKEEKVAFIAACSLAGILACLFLLAPNSQDAAEVAKSSLPPIEYREMKLAPAKKKKVQAQQSVAKASPPPAQTEPSATPAAAEKPQNATLSAIRSIGSTSRLSKLLGKVSATTARSVNVVVSNGVSAGSTPSGRALASIGNTEQSGKDWGSESKSRSINISTIGMKGGTGTAGMGKLAEGKTGTGGAQLLEDESEIVGGLDREVIAQYIRSQLGQILYCYERQLSATPDLFGKVAVRFTISGSGNVETQRIGDSTLRNATVEGCILQKVAKWKFPAPEGGTKVNVTYPFLFKSTN